MATKPILHRANELGRHGVLWGKGSYGERLPDRILRENTARGATLAHRIADLLTLSWIKVLLFLAADMIALLASHDLAEAFTRHSMHLPATFLSPPGYYLFYAPFFTALLYLLDGYKSPALRRPEMEWKLLFKGISFSFVALACANFILFKSLGFSRYLLLEWYALALLSLPIARFGLRAAYGALWRRGLARQKALLLGAPERVASFQQRMAIQRYQGYEMAGVLVEPGPAVISARAFALPILGSLDEWERIADAENARLVVIHMPESSADDCPRIIEIVRRCQQKGIEVEVYLPCSAPPISALNATSFPAVSACIPQHGGLAPRSISPKPRSTC